MSPPDETSNETPEEIPKEVSEEDTTEGMDVRYCKEHGAITDPVIKSDRHFCPECNRILARASYDTPAIEGEAEEDGLLVPFELEQKKEILDFIEDRLKEITGVGKAIKIIMRTLDDNPYPLRDRNTLHAFIKRMAPRAHDPHLATYVIEPLFGRYPMLSRLIDQLITQTQSEVVGRGGGFGQFYPPGPIAQPGMMPYYPFGPPQMQPQSPYQYPPTQYGPQPYPPQPYPHQPQYGGYPQVPQWQSQPVTGDKPGSRKLITKVIDGQAIQMTHQELLAYERWEEEKLALEEQRENRRLERMKLEQEIKNIASKAGDEKVPVVVEGQTIHVPSHMVPLYLPKDESELKETRDALKATQDKFVEALLTIKDQQIHDLASRPSFVDQLEMFQKGGQLLGMSQTGKTSLDVLAAAADNVNDRANQIIARMPPAGLGEDGFSPQVSRTPAEREEKAQEIMEGLEQTEDEIRAENEFLTAASRLPHRTPRQA